LASAEKAVHDAAENQFPPTFKGVYRRNLPYLATNIDRQMAQALADNIRAILQVAIE